MALSAGGGKVYSTDVERRGQVDLVDLDRITRGWNAPYLGWTGDYCGNVDLPLKDVEPEPKRSVSLSQLVRAARNDPGRPQGGRTEGSVDDVRLVEAALHAEGLLPSRWASDGSFGSATLEAYSAWQQRLGYSGTRPGGDADGIPGWTSLTRLGARHGFDVLDYLPPDRSDPSGRPGHSTMNP